MSIRIPGDVNFTAGFKSFCNLGSAMNCDAVMASRYAEVVFGIPLSSLAGGWFLAIFILALLARSDDWRREACRALLAFAAFGITLGDRYTSIAAAIPGG